MKQIEGLFYRDGTPIAVEINNGRINKIIRKEKLDASKSTDVYASPGFIDNQVNGYMGVDFSSPGLTVADVAKVTRALWKVGITTYLPTIVTSPHERLVENFAVLAEAAHDRDISRSIPGFHLEGPFISPENGYRGAHKKD